MFNNLGTPKVMNSKKRLQEEMYCTLMNCGYPISLNLLPVPCKIYDGNQASIPDLTQPENETTDWIINPETI